MAFHGLHAFLGLYGINGSQGFHGFLSADPWWSMFYKPDTPCGCFSAVTDKSTDRPTEDQQTRFCCNSIWFIPTALNFWDLKDQLDRSQQCTFLPITRVSASIESPFMTNKEIDQDFNPIFLIAATWPPIWQKL